MMPVLEVHHVTTYRYRHPVSFGEHRMMFRPRDSHDQQLLETRLRITPEPESLRWVHDVFGNCVALARFAGRARELRFDSTIRLDHSPSTALDFEVEDYARTYPFIYGSEEMPDLLRSVERYAPDPQRAVDRWVRQFLPGSGAIRTHDLLVAITMAISEVTTVP